MQDMFQLMQCVNNVLSAVKPVSMPPLIAQLVLLPTTSIKTYSLTLPLLSSTYAMQAALFLYSLTEHLQPA